MPHNYKTNYESLLAGLNLKEVIEARGGKLLSKYENSKIKVKVECAEGHTWDAWPPGITGKYKYWCPQCANRKPIGITAKRKR